MPMDERAYMTREKLCTAQNKEIEKVQKNSLFCTMKIYRD